MNIVQSLCRDYDKTIKLSRQLDFKSSFSVFQDADSKLQNIDSVNIYLYIKQHSLSTKAYCYFKQKKYELAKAVTIECINIINYLVKQGCHSLKYRCLGQNENIAKLHFITGDWKRAGELFGNILTYLLRGHTRGLIGDFFGEYEYSKKYASSNKVFLYIMFNMGAKYLTNFALKKAHKEPYLFKLLFQDPLASKQDIAGDSLLVEWLVTKEAFFNNEYDRFLLGLTEFMSKSISKDLDFLKLSLLYNFVSYVDMYVASKADKTKLLSEIYTYTSDKLLAKDESRKIICASTLRYYKRFVS